MLGVYRRSTSETTQGRSGLAEEAENQYLHVCRHTSSFLITLAASYSAILGLAPSGLAQALFRTVNHFILQLELFGDMPEGINHNQYHQMLYLIT